jgi:tRNA-specific adenosine deaminase 2
MVSKMSSKRSRSFFFFYNLGGGVGRWRGACIYNLNRTPPPPPPLPPTVPSPSVAPRQCAAALSMMGIRKVYFGCKNDRFGGCGSLLNLHRSDALPSSMHVGFDIVGGILEDYAIRLLRSFYDRENRHAPDPYSRRTRK